MKIEIPQKLKRLNELIPPLYVVGGYVRNALLGICDTDIDLAGAFTPDEVEEKLNGSEFSAVVINRRLGTLKIYCREDKSFKAEYTTFRSDSYPAGSGVHSPENAEFTTDIKTDAMRRDFKVNALYYDISASELLDFAGGVQDIKTKTLSTQLSPQEVFSEDGLRLLRLIRQAAELGFNIDSDTFDTAKAMMAMLNDISKERIRDEFLKILTADQKYPALKLEKAHVRGLRLLDESGALKYILPELLKGKGVVQDSRYHVYDVFEHNLHTFEICPPHLRLAGLVHDIGKPASMEKYGNMYFHSELGASIVKSALGRNGLKFSNDEINFISRLILGHMYDLNGQTSEKKLRLFIVKNADILNDLISLKQADAIASKGTNVNSVSADRLENMYKTMIADGTPFSVKELLINGKDLIAFNINENSRASVMQKVFETAVTQPEMRTRENQLKLLRGLSDGIS